MNFETDHNLPARPSNVRRPRRSDHIVSCGIVPTLANQIYRVGKEEKVSWNSTSLLSQLQPSIPPAKAPSHHGHAIQQASRYVTHSSVQSSRTVIKKPRNSSFSHNKVSTGSAYSKDLSGTTIAAVPRSHGRTQSSDSVDPASFLERLTRSGLPGQRSKISTPGDAELDSQRHHGAKSGRRYARAKGAMQLSQSSEQTPLIYPEWDHYREIQHQRSASDQHNSNLTDCPEASNWLLSPSSPLALVDSCQVSATSNSLSRKDSCSLGQGPLNRNTTPASIASRSLTLLLPKDITTANTASRKHVLPEPRPSATQRHMNDVPKALETMIANIEGPDTVRESVTSSSLSDSSIKYTGKSGSGMKPKHPNSPAVAMPSSPSRNSLRQFRSPKPTKGDEKTLEVGTSTSDQSPLLLSISHLLPHLVNESPPHCKPPARPSRQNTPDLENQLLKPAPVIKSNLKSAGQGSNAHRANRRLIAPSPLPRSGICLQQNKEDCFVTSQYLSHEAVSISPKPLDKKERKRRSLIKKHSFQSSPTESRMNCAPQPGFSFFGWKLKALDTTKRRSKSNGKEVSRPSPKTSTCHEACSRVGTVQHCKSRSPVLSPTVTPGEEVIRTKYSDFNNDMSGVHQTSITQLRADFDGGLYTCREESLLALYPSALTHDKVLGDRLQPDCSQQTPVAQSRLPARRSFYCRKSSSENCLLLPQPIKTKLNISLPRETSKKSPLVNEPILSLQVKHTGDSQHDGDKTYKECFVSRKWNSFGRDQNWQSTKKVECASPIRAIVTVVEKQPIAFYTMIDMTEREEEGSNTNLREVLSTMEPHFPSSEKLNPVESLPLEPLEPLEPGPELQAPTRKASQPPYEASSDDGSIINAEASLAAAAAARAMPKLFDIPGGPHNELAQRGQNPLAVKSRQESISSQGVSQPLPSNSHSLTQSKLKNNNFGSLANDQTLPKLLTAVSDTNVGNSTASDDNAIFSYHNFDLKLPRLSQHGQFLSLSPRSSSDTTICTSSGSCEDWNPLTTVTTAIPQHHTKKHEMLIECEGLLGVYNIQESQLDIPCLGDIPFLLESNYNSKRARASHNELNSPVLCTNESDISIRSSESSVSSSCNTSMTTRIRDTFQGTPSPVPVGMSIGSVDGGLETNDEEIPITKITSGLMKSPFSCHNFFSEGSANTRDNETPQAQVNLRVGSMTVSKWLTFGHVLFSDIRHELASNKAMKHHSILVIDGLGNDDWSFYIAETFQTASVFNLSPRPPLPNDFKNSSTRYLLSPENHHQVQYVSQLDKFPFAPQTFDAIVYRFPSAAPESHYRNVVMEARRVLRPHGFIELSILDFDLNTIGDRGRIVLRKLEEQARQQNPDISFSSTADLLMRLLKRAGFNDIKAARVGIPVASSITPRNMEVGEDNDDPRKTTYNAKLLRMFGDNSRRANPGASKIVSRIGRWWHHRCYESAASHSLRRSIWNDKELLSECEKLGTSLKLVVCCAKAPDDPRH